MRLAHTSLSACHTIGATAQPQMHPDTLTRSATQNNKRTLGIRLRALVDQRRGLLGKCLNGSHRLSEPNTLTTPTWISEMDEHRHIQQSAAT